MAEFIPVLVAAVVLLVILLVVFSGITAGGITQPIQQKTKTVFFGENIIVSSLGKEQSVINVSGSVTRGIIAKIDRSASFDLERVQDIFSGKVNFEINDTNLYGRFIISINGKEIYRDYARTGKHTAEFDKNLLKSKENVVGFLAEGSGWRIWAPTVYFFNSALYVDRAGLRKHTILFDLTEQDLKAERAKFVIFIDSQQGGNLLVNLNGAEIFRGKDNAFRDIPLTALKKGSNAIEFTAEPNSNYDIGTAQVSLNFA